MAGRDCFKATLGTGEYAGLVGVSTSAQVSDGMSEDLFRARDTGNKRQL